MRAGVEMGNGPARGCTNSTSPPRCRKGRRTVPASTSHFTEPGHMNTRVIEVETGLQIQLGSDSFERCLLGSYHRATHCHLLQNALRRETSHPWQTCPPQRSTLESTLSRACSFSTKSGKSSNERHKHNDHEVGEPPKV